MGDKERQDPREGGHTIQQRKQEGAQWETRGDKTLGKADTPFNKGKQEGGQGETKGDKTVRKADTPSNKGKQEGVEWETKGDNTLGKAETPSNKRKQEGVEWETKEGKADTPSNKGKQEGVKRETKGDKTLGKPDTPSIRRTQEGAPWETRGDKTSGRRTHHPTKGKKRGTMVDKGRQDPREGGHTTHQRETRRGTMGDKGRQDPREGGHTIQHQGGHRKKALGTPNSSLFGERKVVGSNHNSSITVLNWGLIGPCHFHSSVSGTRPLSTSNSADFRGPAAGAQLSLASESSGSKPMSCIHTSLNVWFGKYFQIIQI